MRTLCLVMLLWLCLVSGFGCARKTYYVELTSGKTFYADPPLVLDAETGVYHMGVAGRRLDIPMDTVRYIDDAAQICYKNPHTDAYTCYDALYQF